MFKLIQSRLNKSVLWKSLLIGGITPLSGIVMQTIKQRLLFPGNSPPDVGFLVAVSALFFTTGFLFACGFFLFKQELPGKKTHVKGLILALLVNASTFSPNTVAMIAFDYTGLFNLFTAFKLEHYTTAAADFINICFIGLLTGLIARSQDISVEKTAKKKYPQLLLAIFLGAILFPASCALLFFIADFILPMVFNIPVQAKLWFYCGLFIPLCITGIVLPIFYRSVSKALSGNWIKKAVSFATLFFFLFWFTCTLFVVAFGYSIWIVLFFLVVTYPPIVFIVLLSARLFTKEPSSPVAA